MGFVRQSPVAATLALYVSESSDGGDSGAVKRTCVRPDIPFRRLSLSLSLSLCLPLSSPPLFSDHFPSLLKNLTHIELVACLLCVHTALQQKGLLIAQRPERVWNANDQI